MIFIGIGSNLTPKNFNSSLDACIHSVEILRKSGVEISLQSSWYETSPIPISTQPNFINGVISIRTHLESLQLLKLLLKIESEMGRKRDVKNAARVIDLDLIAYNDEIIATKNLILPHPRLTQRAFVIEPIAEIAPDWKHPVLGLRIEKLKSTVAHQKIIRLSY